MDRLVQRAVAAVENTAATALFLITVLSFTAVVARYVFNTGVPDAFDGSRYLLGVVVFWGLASACHRGDHVTMDAVWSASPGPIKRAIDVFAGATIVVGLLFLVWKFAGKVIDTWNSGLATVDLDLPVAVFYSVAWLGLAAALIFAVIRVIRQFQRRDLG